VTARHRALRTAAIAALALAACGGQVDTTARAAATPLCATVASAPAAGSAQILAGDRAQARAALESALAQDPDRLSALNDLAVCYYLDGRFEAARQLLDEVVARGAAREQQAALVNLGEIYALDGYVSAARAHLESARGIDPGRPEPIYALGLLADARGDFAAALALAREALRLDEGGAARQGLAFVYPEERTHLEALLAEAVGDRDLALSRWRDLKAGRFPALAAAAQRRLEEP